MFSHVISLGWFCSTSLELQRIGLRDCSSPFDWLLTPDFGSVIRLIDTRFEDFLAPSYLEQSRTNPDHYRNSLYDVHFFHDFDGYRPFERQISEVQQKYAHRITRFYQTIQEPTLFIRYLRCQEECDGILSDLSAIKRSIKEHNEHNSFMFVANDDIHPGELDVFQFPADEGDMVARRFLEKNDLLLTRLLSLYDPLKQRANAARFADEQARRHRARWLQSVRRRSRKVLLRPKLHHRQYDE